MVDKTPLRLLNCPAGYLPLADWCRENGKPYTWALAALHRRVLNLDYVRKAKFVYVKEAGNEQKTTIAAAELA